MAGAADHRSRFVLGACHGKGATPGAAGAKAASYGHASAFGAAATSWPACHGAMPLLWTLPHVRRYEAAQELQLGIESLASWALRGVQHCGETAMSDCAPFWQPPNSLASTTWATPAAGTTVSASNTTATTFNWAVLSSVPTCSGAAGQSFPVDFQLLIRSDLPMFNITSDRPVALHAQPFDER